MRVLTFTQIGLLMDILGFILIAPTLFNTRKWIPFEPVIGEWRWWLRLTGFAFIVVGFALKSWPATRRPAPILDRLPKHHLAVEAVAAGIITG